MRLPSTRSLEALAAVARLGSLAAAGAELGISVPALSRRIAHLEEALGIRLFARLPRGVALTAVGADYHARVIPILDSLRSAGIAARGLDADVVRLTTIPAFATRWLLPRLQKFTSAHPEVYIDVRTSLAFEDLDTGNFDFAVRLSAGETAGMVFMPIDVVPVWSTEQLGPIEGPDTLAGRTLLGPDHRPEFWREWLQANDIDAAGLTIRDVDALLLYELAMAGAGVAIGLSPLIAPLLKQGRLQALTGHRVRSTRSFVLISRRDRLHGAAALFRDWLIAQSFCCSP